MKTVLLLSVLPSMVFGQQLASPDEKASIEGVVVNELTGAPVKKAEVTVHFPQPTIAITDASGHFAIDGINPGPNAVTVGHRNLLPGKDRAWGQQAGIDDLNLRAGEKRKDIKIGLVPGASISGKVIDEDGEPIRGCRVQLLQPSWETGKRAMQDVMPSMRDTRLFTNDRGEYHFFNLPAKRYYLHAACQDQPPMVRPFGPKDALVNYVEQAYEEQFYPGTPNLNGATRLTPTPGTEMRSVDFRMHKVRVLSVRGRISYAGGSGSNEAIQILVTQKNQVGWTLGPEGPIVTDAGDFEIHGLRPGSYVLSVQSFDDVRQLQGRYDIEVGDLPIKDIVIPVNEGVVLTGTIEMESPLPQPSDQRTFPGADRGRMVLLRPLGDYMGWREPRAEVKEDGSFSFPSVAPGDWELIYRPVPPESFVKSVRLGDLEVSPDRVTITAGAAGPLRILIGANGAEVAGTAKSDTRSSNDRVFVVLFRDGEVPSFEKLHQTVTDHHGAFTLRGVSPGRYHLYAFGSKTFSLEILQPNVLKAIGSQGEELIVEEGEHLTKELKTISAEAIEAALKAAE